MAAGWIRGSGDDQSGRPGRIRTAAAAGRISRAADGIRDGGRDGSARQQRGKLRKGSAAEAAERTEARKWKGNLLKLV